MQLRDGCMSTGFHARVSDPSDVHMLTPESKARLQPMPRHIVCLIARAKSTDSEFSATLTVILAW